MKAVRVNAWMPVCVTGRAMRAVDQPFCRRRPSGLRCGEAAEPAMMGFDRCQDQMCSESIYANDERMIHLRTTPFPKAPRTLPVQAVIWLEGGVSR